MSYQERFEDDGFVYELKIQPSAVKHGHLYTVTQGDGFFGQWDIVQKKNSEHTLVSVTDDQCEIIVFPSVEDAVKGAKEFLALQ